MIWTTYLLSFPQQIFWIFIPSLFVYYTGWSRTFRFYLFLLYFYPKPCYPDCHLSHRPHRQHLWTTVYGRLMRWQLQSEFFPPPIVIFTLPQFKDLLLIFPGQELPFLRRVLSIHNSEIVLVYWLGETCYAIYAPYVSTVTSYSPAFVSLYTISLARGVYLPIVGLIIFIDKVINVVGGRGKTVR